MLASRGPSEALLALHEAYLSLHEAHAEQERRVHGLRGELVASGQALSESRKAHRVHAKRARDLAREAKLLRDAAGRLEAEARSASQQAAALRESLDAEARGRREAQAGREAAALRAEAAEAASGRARKQVDALQEAERGREHKLKMCQELLQAFKGRTRQLREELHEASQRIAETEAFVRRTSGVGRLHAFSFDDEEIRAMAGAVLHNMLVPVDVRFVSDLFRLPKSRTDGELESDMCRNRSSPETYMSLCRSGSEAWRFVRRGLLLHWRVTLWDLMHMRPARLLLMLQSYFDAVTAHVAGAAARWTAAAEEGEECSEACSEEAALQAEEEASGGETLLVVQALNLMLQDAGTPWARAVEVVMSDRALLNPAYLARRHGIYGFRRRSGTVAYRYLNPPSETDPVGVLGVLSETDPIEGVMQALAARIASQHAPLEMSAAAAAQRMASSDGKRPPDAWDRHCRAITLIARRALSSSMAHEFGDLPTGTSRDVVVVRMFGHLVTTMPHLSVTDFAVSFRSVMLMRHHVWVTQQMHLRLTGKQVADAAKAGEESATEGTPSAAPAKLRRSSCGTRFCEAPAKVSARDAEGTPQSEMPQSEMPFELSMADEDSAAQDRPGEVVAAALADVAAPLPEKGGFFNMPMIGMPANYASPPVELRYLLACGRCWVDTPVARAAAGLDICRNTQVRVFMTFCDAPDTGRFERISEWEDQTAGEDARFSLAYSRGLALGLRIHAFVLTPSVMCRGAAPLFDAAGFAADMVVLTRLALGSMVGMNAPQQEDRRRFLTPRLAEILAAVGDQFFPTPTRSGHQFLLGLVSSLYMTVHSEMLLRVYE
jgi:hypothetical protein